MQGVQRWRGVADRSGSRSALTTSSARDGKNMKMPKRHLMTEHGLAPEDYRARWGIKPDYPMVAATYSAQRQDLAKRFGLGRKPAPVPPAPEPKPRRQRKAEA